jgi:hypothetical protein
MPKRLAASELIPINLTCSENSRWRRSAVIRYEGGGHFARRSLTVWSRQIWAAPVVSGLFSYDRSGSGSRPVFDFSASP